MKNKILCCLALTATLLTSIYGCGQKSSSQEPNISKEQTETNSVTPQQEKIFDTEEAAQDVKSNPLDEITAPDVQVLPSNGATASDTQTTPTNDDSTSSDVAIGDAPADTTKPQMPQYEKVSFVGCGDNIIYYGNVRDAQSLSDGTRKYNFKPMFENVRDIISSADIAFINQETVMAGNGYALSYYPRFNSPQELGYDLCELGYDVVNIANNHMLDKGADGLLKTIEFWDSMDCLMTGGYKNAEDYAKIRTTEKNGIKIAFLSYTYATNGIQKPASSPLVIPYIDHETIKSDIASAKSQAEFVIVSVHWGAEGAFKPNAEQKSTAQLIADCGADVIIGHHPHVIQPVEWLTGKDGNRTLCVYSLGNFAAEQAYDYNMVGGMISFDIISVDNGKPYVENPIFTPTVYHFDKKFYNNSVHLMKNYTKELADAHGVRLAYGHSFNLGKLGNYVKNTIPQEFLPQDFVFPQ